jgi:hypothetical protein
VRRPKYWRGSLTCSLWHCLSGGQRQRRRWLLQSRAMLLPPVRPFSRASAAFHPPHASPAAPLVTSHCFCAWHHSLCRQRLDEHEHLHELGGQRPRATARPGRAAESPSRSPRHRRQKLQPTAPRAPCPSAPFLRSMGRTGHPGSRPDWRDTKQTRAPQKGGVAGWRVNTSPAGCVVNDRRFFSASRRAARSSLYAFTSFLGKTSWARC